MNNLISIGLGREAAFSAAVLGDNALMEKAWQDTGMLAEAVLHAHVRLILYMHFILDPVLVVLMVYPYLLVHIFRPMDDQQ